MKTIKVSVTIDLTQQMIDRYKNLILDIEVKTYCPVCEKYKTGIYPQTCIDCFNRDNDFELGCTNHQTFFNNPYRLLYWKEVLKYLNSYKSNRIRITTLRNKCNQIDNLLI